MNASEIQQLLSAAITDADHIAVEGDGGKVQCHSGAQLI